MPPPRAITCSYSSGWAGILGSSSPKESLDVCPPCVFEVEGRSTPIRPENDTPLLPFDVGPPSPSRTLSRTAVGRSPGQILAMMAFDDRSSQGERLNDT